MQITQESGLDVIEQQRNNETVILIEQEKQNQRRNLEGWRHISHHIDPSVPF